MSSELADTVLKGVLDGDPTRYFYLYERTEPDYFTGPHRDLWKILTRYYDVTKTLLNKAALDKTLPRSSLPVDRVTKVEDLWSRLENMEPVSEPDFRASIELFLEDYRAERLGEAYAEGMEILVNGRKDEENHTILQGPDDSLRLFREAVSDVEEAGLEAMPEFDIRAQKDDLLAELASENTMNRLPTGIVPLDEMMGGGMAPGELWLPAAGTGIGKSFFCTNVSHFFAVNGNNVIYFTTETLFKQIRHRILVRHSREEKFGVPGGLSSARIKKHTPSQPTLTPEEHEQYIEVINDWSDNEEYGKLVVVQVPDGTKISTLQAKAERWRQYIDGEVHLVVIDSPDMLYPDYRRSDERHNLNEVVNRCKSFATSFNGGAGTRVLAPWQTSRAGQEKAKETGRYDKSAMSDTQMAEKRADLILAMLEQENTPTRLKAQTLKVRDAQPVDFELNVDYDSGYLGSDESLAGDDLMGDGLL